MDNFFQELNKLTPSTLAGFTALAGAIGAIVASVITAIVARFVVTPFLGARDKQDREVEWRKHAIELTKLDLDRKLKAPTRMDVKPVRPSILDFLANYRDLQELGQKSPKELYKTIIERRVSAPEGATNPNGANTNADAAPTT
ncbi:hypothetical protein [Mesorhizobium sp. WSM2239]|uniref:Uncharacterized protein n=2 Tax=unclassified Mesorhizobium TaxID=325217 RepID=A0AAU8DGN9_9HYPH